jgi:putative ABC transport system permease protein
MKYLPLIWSGIWRKRGRTVLIFLQVVVAFSLFGVLFVGGLSASPFGYSFRLDVTADLVRIGMIWALVMGCIGGILPAARAARVPVTTALRAV